MRVRQVVDARKWLERNGHLISFREATAQVVQSPPMASAAARMLPPKSKAKTCDPA